MTNYCAVCGKKLGILESGATLDNNQSEFKICMDCKTKEERLVVEREEKDFGYMHSARKWFNNCLEQGRVEDGAVETVKRLIRESEKSETDNLEFHNNRSTQTNNLMITTGYNFEGYRILEYKSVLSGEVVLGTGFFSEFDASVSDILGMSSSTMEGKLSEAKNMAMNNLIKKAVALESNALIGIDFDIMTIGKNMIVVSVNGTAVLIEKIEYGEINE